MSESKGTKPVVKTITKTPTTKPGENLQVKLMKVADVEYLRIFIGGPGEEVPLEIIFHRPIGITDLDKDQDWVRSNPTDVAHLLARIKDPHEEELRQKRIESVKAKAVKKGLITIDTDNVVSYPSGMKRNEFLKPLREAVKKEAKLMRERIKQWQDSDAKTRTAIPPPKPNENIMLKEALAAIGDTIEAKEEVAFSAFMAEKANMEAAEKEFPATYKTLKGAYADIPQVPIKWANGLTLSELQKEVGRFTAILTGRKPKDLGPRVASVLTVTEVKSKKHGNA